MFRKTQTGFDEEDQNIMDIGDDDYEPQYGPDGELLEMEASRHEEEEKEGSQSHEFS